MFHFENVKHCQRMNYKGWKHLSQNKLNRFVECRKLKAIVFIQRWYRNTRHVTNDVDFVTFKKLNSCSAFTLYEGKCCYLFHRQHLIYWILQSQQPINPYTRNLISIENLRRLFFNIQSK